MELIEKTVSEAASGDVSFTFLFEDVSQTPPTYPSLAMHIIVPTVWRPTSHRAVATLAEEGPQSIPGAGGAALSSSWRSVVWECRGDQQWTRYPDLDYSLGLLYMHRGPQYE